MWNSYGHPDQVAIHLESSLAEHIDNVDALLTSFVGVSWGMETGLSHVSDLDRDIYEAIKRYVNPEFVAGQLRAKYGDELDEPQYYHDSDFPVPRRLAHQFMHIHQQALTTGDGAPE